MVYNLWQTQESRPSGPQATDLIEEFTVRPGDLNLEYIPAKTLLRRFGGKALTII